MFSFALVIAGTGFLAGMAATVFLVVVIGIRRNDRPRRLPGRRGARPGAFTRVMLGTGTWPDELISPDARDDGCCGRQFRGAATGIRNGRRNDALRPVQAACQGCG